MVIFLCLTFLLGQKETVGNSNMSKDTTSKDENHCTIKRLKHVEANDFPSFWKLRLA